MMLPIKDFATDDIAHWLNAHFIRQDEINDRRSDLYIAEGFSRYLFAITRQDLCDAMKLAGFTAQKAGTVYCFNVSEESPAFALFESHFE